MIKNDLGLTRLIAGPFRPAFAAAFAIAALTTTPVLAQTPGSGLASSYSANADKPIDIEADMLEVDDKKKVAVFRGNVSATQGDFNLRAKEIQVKYASKDKSKQAEDSGSSAVPGGGAADITQIDAKGKVLIKTKDDQTATSDWAIFDVQKQLITIGGDVKLSQGANMMKGDKLVIDLTTGISRFERPKDGRGDGRGVKMIFTPKERTKSAN